jgi:hypothetical protein
MKRHADSDYSVPGSLAVAALAAWLVLPAAAGAAGFLYQFDAVFGASTVTPAGAAPWLSATFVDSPSGVLMTLSNLNLAASEKTGVFDFNLNPSQNPASLTFTFQSSVGSFTSPTISTGVDANKADGDGYYDIQLQFDVGGGSSSSFDNGESVTYLVGGIGGLTVEDFEYLSTPSGGGNPFYAAAHIQGTGGGGSSAWTEPSLGPLIVPEPASSVMLGLAAGMWYIARLGGRKRTKS